MSGMETRSQKKARRSSDNSFFELGQDLQPSRLILAPVKRKTRLTVPEPFNLQSEVLSAVAKQRQKEMQLAAEQREAEMREFKAKESFALGSPFLPKPSNNPLTVPESPDLKSTTRAEARQDFESEKNRRLEEKRLRKEAELAQIAKDEETEALALRGKMVFKARPFVEAPPMVVRKSARPLTLAVSPLVRQRGTKRQR